MAVVAIVGSRDYPDLLQVWHYVSTLLPDTIIVTGGAPGVDKTAEDAARQFLDTEPVIIEAEWEKYGKGAGPIRNSVIAELCDSMVCFCYNNSRGAMNAVGEATRRGKHVTIYAIDDNAEGTTKRFIGEDVTYEC